MLGQMHRPCSAGCADHALRIPPAMGCASATAWYDAAVSNDVAHRSTECSSRGNCDYGTGTCTCQEGFEGRACERLSCPNGCGGHGTCVSLESLAHHELLLYNVNWDHDKIYGCRCDAGFTGYDCSLHVCCGSGAINSYSTLSVSLVIVICLHFAGLEPDPSTVVG